MDKTPKYRNTRFYMSNYGFSPTYWRSIFKKIGYSKSNDGTRSELLMDENLYIEFLESRKVKGTQEVESIAALA